MTPVHTSVLCLCPERVGGTMAGPAIRSLELAKALSADFSVGLFAPAGSKLGTNDIRLHHGDVTDAGALRQLARRYDVIVSYPLPPAVARKLAGSGARLVFDLYDPTPVEVFEHHKNLPPEERQHAAAVNTDAVRMAMLAADFLICATEKQRDLWIGGMLMRGLVDAETYHHDSSLRDLIDVVPFGIAEKGPKQGKKTLKGVVPGISESDSVILWGGGIWSWLDALSVVKAVEKVSRTRNDVKLFFLGVKRPEMGSGDLDLTSEEVLDYAHTRQLIGKSVFVNEGWVPYQERANFLMDSDIGVSTHFDNLETRYSFRTRILDYIWAGLPIVATRGDSFADLIERRELGLTVDFEDVDALAAAFTSILDDARARRAYQSNITAVQPAFYWRNAVTPLRNFIKSGQTRPKNNTAIRLLSSGQRLHGVRKRYRQDGLKGVAKKIFSR